MTGLTRRIFIRDLGLGAVGIAVGGTVLTACGNEPPAPAPPVPATGSSAASRPADSGGLTVRRVRLDFVSAYVLVRGRNVAIVDTGVGGSAGEIERALAEVGVGWSDVGSVILTHRHPDHVGSLGDVAASAEDAVLFAGAADVEAIEAPRPLEPVGDGDTVLGLAVVESPGHTPGHISVFDPDSRILVAGDALNGDGSGVETIVDGVGGPNPRFTADMSAAVASVAKLAALSPDTIYFGHGEPRLGGAADALAALVSRL